MLNKKTLTKITGNVIPIILLALVTTESYAENHIIDFGGALGFAYSPKNFSAFVGDSVQWQGDFTMHPLSSTTIPVNAAKWHNAAGTVFTYVITVPGDYNYECDFHVSLGMIGSFSAVSVGIKDNPFIHGIRQSSSVDLKTISAGGKTVIRFVLAKTESVSLRIVTPAGAEVSTIIGKRFTKGVNQISLGDLSNGFYLLGFSIRGETVNRRIAVVN